MFFSKCAILGAMLNALRPASTKAEQLIIAIDESSSMYEIHTSVKSSFDALFNELNSPTVFSEPKIGIVGYGAGPKFSHDAYTATPLTDDATTLQTGLDTLIANGGNEFGYKLAIDLANNKIRGDPLGVDLNPTKGFCLVLISDEILNQDENLGQTDVEAAFAATGGVFLGVGRLAQEDKTLAANTGGKVVTIEEFLADPTGVIDALIAKCKHALPAQSSTKGDSLVDIATNTKNVVDVVGGTVEWVTMDLMDKVEFTADALLETNICLLTHTVHKVNGLLSEIIVTVNATLEDIVITLEQKTVYVDGVLDKVLFEVVCAIPNGNTLLHALFEDVGGVVTAVSEVIDGTTDDIKTLLGNRLVEVDGLLQLILSTVNDNVDDLTSALITDDEMGNMHLLCGNFVQVLGLGKLLDGNLLGGLDADLDLCPCFSANDLISVEACVEIEHLNSLDYLGVTACRDDLSLEAGVATNDYLVAKASVDLNGVFQCALSENLLSLNLSLSHGQRKNRRNLRQRNLLLGKVVNNVVNTVDNVVDTVVDTADTVVDTTDAVVDTVVDTADTVVDTVDTLLSNLSFDEYNSCLSLLLQRCQEVPRCN